MQQRQLQRQVDGGEPIGRQVGRRGHGHGNAQGTLRQRGGHGVGLFREARQRGVGRGGQVLGRGARAAWVAQRLPGQGVQLRGGRVDVQADAALGVLAARPLPGVAQAGVGQQAVKELSARGLRVNREILRQAGGVQKAVAQALDRVQNNFDGVPALCARADVDIQVGELGCRWHGRPSVGWSGMMQGRTRGAGIQASL